MNKLYNLREQINVIDNKIILLLVQRMKVVRKIGELKKKQNLPFFDAKRKQKMIELNLLVGQSLKLPSDFIKKLFTLIHNYSLKIQQEISHD